MPEMVVEMSLLQPSHPSMLQLCMVQCIVYTVVQQISYEYSCEHWHHNALHRQAEFSEWLMLNLAADTQIGQTMKSGITPASWVWMLMFQCAS